MAIKEVEVNEYPRTQKVALGFIGMGHMGSHMARRLLAAGYQLTVYDRTREKAQALEKLGALVAATPRDLAARSDVVLVMVYDDAAQEQVMFGPQGALAGVHEGSLIIDLSTVPPALPVISIRRRARRERR